MLETEAEPLQVHGYHVLTVQNPWEAVELLRAPLVTVPAAVAGRLATGTRRPPF